MKTDGDASGPAHGFVHKALIYGSDEEFTDVALPFLEDGLEAREPILVAVQRRHLENVRAVLGGTPDGLTLLDVEEWHESSARTRDGLARWTSERLEGADHVRLVVEPPWATGNDARVRDWARHEAVFNVAFSGLPVSLICPYDAGELPREVLQHAHCTHPDILDSDGSTASSSYEDPSAFCDRMDSGVRREGRAPDLEQRFDLGDLSSLRRSVGSFAIEAGLSPLRTEETVLAVNEIATNAVLHGRPPSTVRGWRGGDEIIVEVTDAGEGISDALAGQLPPQPESPGGRGLWLTRLVCDAVEVRSADGCSVTMHIAAPGDEALTTASRRCDRSAPSA
jgi:anti-sigma regulatory factor (Ser/Thr protein kinase)